MRASFLTIVIILLHFSSKAQSTDLLTLDQLNHRVEAGNDTVYIVNFFATWCGPCVKELSAFEKFNQAYGKKEKVKVLLISLDYVTDLETRVRPFVKKKGLKNEVYVLNETNQQKYIDAIDKSWAGTIPSTLFVKNGGRKFVEEEFSYIALETEYKNFKSRQ